MESHSEVQESDYDDGDLEVTSSARPAGRPNNETTSVTGEQSGAKENGGSERPEAGHPPLAQVLETGNADFDEDFGDPEAAYKEYKRWQEETRKRKARPRKPKTKKAKRDAFVGIQPKKESGGEPSRKKRRVKISGNTSSDDEKKVHKDVMPDYLRKRQVQFDRKLDMLKDAGLKVPPDFNDIYFSDDDHLESIAERPMFRNSKPCAKYKDINLHCSMGLIPAPIAQWLREYQVEGAAFLHQLFVYQRGGILGDDMGLGKTIQVIAFLAAAYGKTGDERDAKRMRKMRRAENKWYPRTLIVCPGSLLQNWQSELLCWGWWHIEIYHGADKDQALLMASSGRLEIMLTTYATYRMNRGRINMVEWDCVIADECHAIKEEGSQITMAMNEVNALCRIGLTGTAIQNKYEELWMLLNWTNPGKFGTLTDWTSTICQPLRVGQSHDATHAEIKKRNKTIENLRTLLPHFFLRRMKSLIANQLPKKADRVVFCPLTDTQADSYENFLNSDIVTYIKYSSDLCDCNSGKKRGSCCYKFLPSEEHWGSYTFPGMATLQKISNHLALLIPQGVDPREKQDKDLQTLEIAIPDQARHLYHTRDSIINYANPEFCGKWKVLRKLLKWWHVNGDKVLVFSHSVRILKMLQMLFKSTSYNVSYLDGSLSYEERAKVVDEYNADPRQFVFLISSRAGGVGLNITSANKVVVVDPNWNPSHDLQAQDRAYRIGQTRDVEVFRLISAGTIEEIVYARQIYKQQQANIGYTGSVQRRYFHGVQGEAAHKGEIFGLKNLFAYHSKNVVLKDIVNKTNVAENKAGVEVIGIDVKAEQEDEQDDGDRAMMQLADKIRDGVDEEDSALNQSTEQSTKRRDPVQAILDGAGVEYSHFNDEVIGSSKVEEQLSRRAEQVDLQSADAQVFSETQDETILRNGDEEIVLKFRPPKDVIRRQFCSIAAWYRYANATEFGLAVEKMSQGQRQRCLDTWYSHRREVLAPERPSKKL